MKLTHFKRMNNMLRPKLFKNLLTAALLVICVNMVQAGIIPAHGRIYTPTLTSPVVISTPTATTYAAIVPPYTSGSPFTDHSVTDMITLGVDQNNPNYITTSGEIVVTLKIEKYDPTETSIVSTTTQDLILEYQPFNYSSPYVDKSTFTFANTYKYVITIQNITVGGAGVSILPANLFINADIQVERYYDFASIANSSSSIPTSISQTLINTDCDADGINDEIRISWDNFYGSGSSIIRAEEYQLEWTFVNDYDQLTPTPTYKSASSLNYDFRNNSTRITTADPGYNISLTFEHGYLLYRVRAVGRLMSDPTKYIYGQWSELETGNVASIASQYYNTVEHEGNKNWQYSTTYAEEGKKKEVISYFDGSLRNRQSVTKVNSDNNTIVGETIYDFQGRPAVNVLPVPVPPVCPGDGMKPALKFYPKFNENGSSAEYSRTDFDVDASDPCTNPIIGMNTVSGASNYYSPANTVKNGAQAFVPDATGPVAGIAFPFTQIEYTPDNTGRIRKQGGVGFDYQLGNGHETKYFYGWPNQPQLDRLFGSEVGDAAHYKKNVVVDANGQVSISYLDQEGRTIATSLAGDAPQDASHNNILSTIPSGLIPSQNLTIDLFAKNSNGVSSVNVLNAAADAIVFNSQLTVDYKSDFVFNYSLDIDPYTNTCLASGICFDCVYDLEIKVTDDCGNPVPSLTTGLPPIVKKVGKFTLNTDGSVTFLLNCPTSPLVHETETFTLPQMPVGNYTVSKVLTVDHDARDFYVNAYLDSTTNTCFQTLHDFTAAALLNIDTTACNIDCAACAHSLQTINGQYYSNVNDARDAFVAAGFGTELEFDVLLEDCGAPCQPTTWCETTYQQLLIDVSPDGQYAGFQTADNVISPGSFTLSVLNNTSTNLLPVTITGLTYGMTAAASWRNPIITISGTPYRYYLEEDGTRSIIHIAPNGSGGFSPAVNHNDFISGASAVWIKYDAAGDFYYTYPENLANVGDFVANWNNNWAKSLVQYHPEYCYYETCKNYSEKQLGDVQTPDDMDELLNNTNTYADAVAKNLIHASYLTTDPIPVSTIDKMAKFTYSTSPLKDPFEFNTSVYGPYTSELDYKVHHYQTFGSTTYSMIEAAAITARCGTMYGTTPGTATCQKFGQDVGLDPTENTRIRDMEWNMFKNFYLSEKRKLQQVRADYIGIHSCKEYNGCIGNSDYNPFVSGMLGAGSGFSFLSSPYFDHLQPCSAFFMNQYLTKQKRFIGPDDIHSPSPSEMDYQMYLQTGQCPMAVDLQSLLSGLASHSKLDNAAGEDLTHYGEFTPDMYNEVSGGAPSSFIPYLWKGNDLGNTLKAYFYNTLTNSNVCEVNLDKTGTGIASWSNIVAISQLTYTSTSGSLYNFTVMATVVTGTTTSYKVLTGSSCLKITGCSFPPVCDANDFAKDLSKLMSALIFNHDLTNSSVDLSIPVSDYLPLLTTNIKTALGTTNNSLIWNFTGSNFELFDGAAPTKKLIIKFTGFSPTTYNISNLYPTVKAFANVKSNNENFFTIDGIDALNSTVVTINGSVTLMNGSASSEISMGTCGLPQPLTCTGDPNQLRTDLGALLKDVLLKKPFTGNIDLTTSTDYTTLIQSYLPSGLTHTSSSDVSASGAGGYSETLTFNIATQTTNCEMVLTHHGPNPARFFTDLSDLSVITAYGTPGFDDNYYTFYMIGTYSSYGGGALPDTIFGSSCLPLKNCMPCTQAPEPECVQCKLVQIVPPSSGCINQVTSFTYTTDGCNGTPKLLWNFGDGTVSSNGDHVFTSAGTYLIELSTVQSQTCPQILASVNITITDCGGSTTISRDPIYFNAADSIRLASGILVTDTAVNAYQSYVAKIMQLDSINGWAPTDTGYVATVDYVTYYANADKYSLGTYNSFILNYDPTIDSKANLRSVSAFITDYGNYTNCTKEYDRYVRALNKYNQRAIIAGFATQTAIADTTFYNNGLCDSAKVFIKALKAYPGNGLTPANVQTFLTTSSSLPPSGPCLTEYNHYTSAYNAFVQYQASHNTCPDYQTVSPLYSYADFVKAGLCSTVAGLTAFDNYITSFSAPTPCPGSMPQVSGGTGVDPKTCQRLYIQFKTTITNYNASAYATAHGYSLDVNIYPSYLAFIEAGLCDCVEKYISYLQAFISLPPTWSTPAALSIDHYSSCTVIAPPIPDPCADAYKIYLTSISSYNAYVMAHPELSLPLVIMIYKPESFTASGYCYCVSAYTAFLQTIIDGSADLSKVNRANLYVDLDIAQTCAPSIKPPCVGSVPQDTVIFPKPKYTNPCVEQQINLAIANAQNAYNQYVDSLTTFISNAYTKHCLGALENFTTNYNDKEYHVTLYYYDQAGNLVKTIPPEGVHPVDLSLFGSQIINDRTNSLHTFYTGHTMATNYEYNSLNQLVKQNMPDHDPMDIWEFALPNGLDSRLNITATQFVTSTKGYLSGYVTVSASVKRGYLYTTDDGGATWTKMNDIIASDLKKIQMVNSTIGYAVGSNSIVVKTIDGGTTWDITQLYNSTAATINDLYFADATHGVIVGDNGFAMKTTDGATYVNISTTYLPNSLNYTSITFDGTSYYVTGNKFDNSSSKIYKGTTAFVFAQQTSIRSTDLVKVQMLGANGFAIGVNGTFLKTTNSGVNWTPIPTGTTNNFKDLYFQNSAKGVAIISTVAGEGQIWKTIDGGVTWTLLSVAGDSYNSFNFYQADKGYALGNNAKMKRVVISTPGSPLLPVTIGLVDIPTSSEMAGINFKAASFSNDDKGWVVGNNDKIFYTINGTNPSPTWQHVSLGLPPADQDFKDIYFGAIGTANNSGILLGANGKVYKLFSSPSATGTAYSATLISSVTENFVDIDDFGTAGAGSVYGFDIAAGATGQLKSVAKLSISGATALTPLTNAGATLVGANVVSIFAKGAASIFTVGKNGDIFTGAVSGATITWTNNSKGNNPLPLNDIQAAGAQNIYAVGNDGSVLQTVNGVDWTTLSSSTTEQLNAIKFNTLNNAATAGTTGLVAGNNGILFRQVVTVSPTPATVASTIALTPITTSTTENLYDIALNTSNFAYTSGGHGTLISIPNILVPVPTFGSPQPGGDLRGIDFVSGTTSVYSVGDHSAIFNYSTSTITPFPTSGAKIKSVFTSKISDVNFVNSLNGYFVGDNDVIRHTDDGGATWKYVAPRTPGGAIGSIGVLTGVWTTDNNKAFIIGKNYKANIGDPVATILPVGLTVTVNTSFSIAASVTLNDVAFRGSTGYIVGAPGTTGTQLVYKSTNSGVTWTALPPYTTTGVFKAIHIFQDPTKFVVVGTSKVIFCYNGTAFNPIAAPSAVLSTVTFNDVFFHDDRNGYVAGSNGTILRCSTPNNIFTLGATTNSWTAMPLTGVNGVNPPLLPANVNITTVDFASRYHGFLGGNFTSGTPNYARLVDDESKILSTRFWYDRLGRMVVSQNTKQYNRKNIPTLGAGLPDYSYTLYDVLGRILEVGEKTENDGTAGHPVFATIFGDDVNGAFNPNVIKDANLLAWVNGGTRREVTHTYYDNVIPGFTGLAQENLRKRVSSVTYEDVADTGPGSELTYQHATHYSYDIHGNVKTLYQDNKKLYDEAFAISSTSPLLAQRYKQVDYEYDLISGKVNLVRYQDGQPDAFYHFYEYDADNRITAVYTSRYPQANTLININTVLCNSLWEKEAKYMYYAHGPLARVEVGDSKTQAMDYAYTLQGWIKGVNSNILNEHNDMGQDGLASGTFDPIDPNIHKNIAKDAFGYTLNYRANDYSPINTTLVWSTVTNRFEAVTASSDLDAARFDLFNGNISSMVTSIEQPAIYTPTPSVFPTVQPQGTAYKYDQLNRIMEMKAYANLDIPTNTWLNGSAPNDRYHNIFAYDANGNILSQKRADVAGLFFDDLTYNYAVDPLGNKSQNRLYQVHDASPNSSATDDIDDQDQATPIGVGHAFQNATANTTNNYRYDEIGNLSFDNQEEIREIDWTVYGKIKRIIRTVPSAKSDLEFNYDASGNRISKIVKPHGSSIENGGVDNKAVWTYTYYSRDAQGNIMTTYKKTPAGISTSFKVIERNIFGSCRLGTENTEIELISVLPLANPFTRTLGDKHYEASNHLGNVLTVFTDKKYPRDDNADGIVDYYQPDIVNTFDYTPFGAPMNERTYRLVMKYDDASHTTSSPKFVDANEPVANIASENLKYRYGFNGKEKDDEVFGIGDSYDYGKRIYDTRLGRFLTVDPITKNYPMLTPYQFASNRPIDGIDLDGLEYTQYSSFKLVAYKRQTYFGLLTSVDVIKTASTPKIFDNNLPVHYSSEGKTDYGTGSVFKTEFEDQPDPPDDDDNPYLPTTETGNKIGAVLDGITKVILPAINWAINKEEIDANKKLKSDAKALNLANALVNKSINHYNLKISEQVKTDLINYVNDGSLPSAGVNLKGKSLDQIKAIKAYDGAIEKLGKLIYAHKDDFRHDTKQDKDYIKVYGEK